jgi:hypothetical protein
MVLITWPDAYNGLASLAVSKGGRVAISDTSEAQEPGDPDGGPGLDDLALNVLVN